MVMRLLSSPAGVPPALVALLEHVGLPAILVAGRGSRIVAGNLEASRQSGYSREGLSRLGWEQLFPEISWEMLAELEGREIVTFLQRRDGSSRQISCEASRLGEKGDLWLVTFTLPAGRGEKVEVRESVLERVIRQSVEGLEDDDPDAMLERLLMEISRIVQSAWGALYLLESPAYRLRSRVGAAPELPLILPLQDSEQFKQPHRFGPTEVAATALHAVVRTAEAPYIIAAPLGQGQALEGFVVFGYVRQPPAGMLRRVAILARGLRQVMLCRLHSHRAREEELRARQVWGVTRVLLQHAYEGILIFDDELRLRGLSHAAEALLGYEQKEIIGAAFADLLVGEVALETAARHALALNQPQAIGAHLLRRDGAEFPVEVRLVPCVPDGDDRPQGLVVLLQDLSKEEQYRLQTQRLMWRAMLGDVLASFAHEVRDPLNSISTGLEWLAFSLAEDASEHQTVAALQQDVERLDHLVKHLLEYSRTRTLHLKPLDVGALVESILRRWERRFKRYRIETTFYVARDVPPALGDRLSLEQIFVNLIDNAIKAVKDQPGERFVGIKVSRATSENGVGWVEVAVTDNGPGFTDEVARHIFEPFYTTRKDGFGLGLSITKQLVTAHRGNIEAFSYPGGGTVFRVRLRAVEKG